MFHQSRPDAPAPVPGSGEPLWPQNLRNPEPAAAEGPPGAYQGGFAAGLAHGSLPDARRFAALSTLPAGRRLPAKRDVPLARHLRQEPSPGESMPPAPPAGPVLPPASSRQLGFNCPSCFTVLIIKDPTTYDGRPAPCPTCGIRIQPPQCAPASPFSIVHRPGPAVPPGRLPG